MRADDNHRRMVCEDVYYSRCWSIGTSLLSWLITLRLLYNKSGNLNRKNCLSRIPFDLGVRNLLWRFSDKRHSLEFLREETKYHHTLSMIATYNLINYNNPQLSPFFESCVVTIIKEIRDPSVDAEWSSVWLCKKEGWVSLNRKAVNRKRKKKKERERENASESERARGCTWVSVCMHVWERKIKIQILIEVSESILISATCIDGLTDQSCNSRDKPRTIRRVDRIRRIGRSQSALF